VKFDVLSDERREPLDILFTHIEPGRPEVVKGCLRVAGGRIAPCFLATA
jgi:hypothetical protein